VLVAVAGDSGSGKTTYTEGIARLLGPELVAALSLDGYHKENRLQRQHSGRSPLDPRANELDLVRQHLERLRSGRSVTVPVYDHDTGVFGTPRVVRPFPVVIVEGLHALYPELLDAVDFSIYVDTDEDVKRRWKLDRDVRERGYNTAAAQREIDQREADYRRWIDFQKTNADVIVRIHESEMASLAVDEYTGEVPSDCHHMEIIVAPTQTELPPLNLPVDLNNMTQHQAMPFMLANVPSSYWGRRVNVVHIDGIMPKRALGELERDIMRLAGIPAASQTASQRSAAILFTQLLVVWPFLGHLLALLGGEADENRH
jgi:phosphoribulokinase